MAMFMLDALSGSLCRCRNVGRDERRLAVAAAPFVPLRQPYERLGTRHARLDDAATFGPNASAPIRDDGADYARAETKYAGECE
jgi:hypothetical protein